MSVCSYYLRGACKYGDRCRNEHPGASTLGNQTWTSSNNRISVPYTAETITADVTPNKDKPLWPLSSYGPAKYEPVVIGGLDESPEELHLKAVTALRAGSTGEYTKYEAEKMAAADQMFVNARDNVRQVYDQALKASIQDHIRGSSVGPSIPSFTTSTPSAFGTNSAPSAFGGTSTSGFGKPAFGQPVFGQTGLGGTTTGTSAFGQGQGTQGVSAFGISTQPISAFSQPAQATSAFGGTQTTSALNQPNPVFGQPSAFGAATTKPTPVFGKPPQPTPMFGQPSQSTSAFGQTSQPTSAFGQPSQSSSAFGQPAQSTSAFGQPAQPTSTFSQLSQASSTFGRTSQPAFGQSSLIKPASSAFGAAGGGGFSAFAAQPSSFTAAAAPSTSATGTTPSQPAFGNTTQVQSAFGTIPSTLRASQPTSIGTSLFGNTVSAPAISAPSPASAFGSGGSFASPMTVTPSSEKPASGVPDFASAKSTAKMRAGADRYLDLLPPDYNEIIPVEVMTAFTNAKFEWGKIPEWTPPAEVR